MSFAAVMIGALRVNCHSGYIQNPSQTKAHMLIFVELACGYNFCKVLCVCASVLICPGHNFDMYAWISKLFGTVVLLEEGKCHLKHFWGGLTVKVTLEGQVIKWS